MKNIENCMFTNQEDLENAALQLQALLKVLSIADPDNTALTEIPHALKIAADIAEKIYSTIAECVKMEV